VPPGMEEGQMQGTEVIGKTKKPLGVAGRGDSDVTMATRVAVLGSRGNGA
jgi:hypothetical protein